MGVDPLELLGGEPPRITVRGDRARPLLQRHPWVYANSLKHPPKNLPAGVAVDLVSEKGEFLARGCYNDLSQIVVRVLTFDPAQPINREFIRQRVAAAVERRRDLLDNADCTACRLVFAEADRLPGLIVDRYGDWLVIQVLNAGMEIWRDAAVEELVERLGPRGVYERSETQDRRQHEGLEPREGLVWGEEPPAWVEVLEHGVPVRVDLRRGHKTGAYLDQRENHAAVAKLCRGGRILNAFSYTGGFGLGASLAGAAAVTHVDSSAPALALCRENIERLGTSCVQEYLEGNVFEVLRELRQADRTFDGVILDPPKFAAGKKSLDRATRGYKDVNLSALRLVEPGGWLATFSCSGAVDAGLFRRILADAASDAGREVQIVQELGQPADHPVLLSFPEGSYLTGLILRVLE